MVEILINPSRWVSKPTRFKGVAFAVAANLRSHCEMKLLLLLTVAAAALHSCASRCQLHRTGYWFFNGCSYRRPPNQYFYFCSGMCLSSVQFEAVQFEEDTTQAYSACTGIQNCCKHGGTVEAVGQNDLIATPECLQKLTLPLNLPTIASTCDCTSCYGNSITSVGNVNIWSRVEDPLTCRPTTDFNANDYYPHHYSTCHVRRIPVEHSFLLSNGETCTVQHGTQGFCDGLCSSSSFDQSHCKAINSRVRWIALHPDQVRRFCPAYNGGTLRYMYVDIDLCVCTAN